MARFVAFWWSVTFLLRIGVLEEQDSVVLGVRKMNTFGSSPVIINGPHACGFLVFRWPLVLVVSVLPYPPLLSRASPIGLVGRCNMTQLLR